MAVVLGLLVSLAYGCGDFLGGLSTKRARVTAVVAGLFAISTAAISLVTLGWGLVADLPSPTSGDLLLGVGTGLIGPLALGLLYEGLASGRMSVVAPITAVVAAVVPFAWGLSQGERPGTTALVGVGLALLGVLAVSGAPAHPGNDSPTAGSTTNLSRPAEASTARTVGLALGAGVGFGAVYVMLGSTSDQAWLWPLVVARPISLLTVILGVGATLLLAGDEREEARTRLVAPRAVWPMVAGAGILDVTANSLYITATRLGPLSIVAVLSALYPAATVVLARVVLHERLHRLQLVGLALATTGVVAMATG